MPLLQLVPSRVCLSCDVCCRFPEPDSFLRPYFTAEEIRRAVMRGIDRTHFSDPNGCQVSVVPNPSGEGYLCPAFDPATSHCRIYEDRPLDCQIYPLAIMWAPPLTPSLSPQGRGMGEGKEVVLGWDVKCPFLNPGNRQWAIGDGQNSSPLPMTNDLSPDLRVYADKITELLERDETIETLAGNPRLIGRFQEDVVILNPLPKLTARMCGKFEVRSSKLSENLEPPTSNLELRALTPADHDRFRQALARMETPLAHYALPPHLIWTDLLRYSWTEIAGCWCLFAEYADGLFMPLPPLPLTPALSPKGRGGSLDGVSAHGQGEFLNSLSPGGRGEGEGGLAPALAACFAIMRERNKGSAVSRVENVPEEWVSELQAQGYRVKPKDPDYLYRTADLVALAGDNYKSQRAACNRFEREYHSSVEPYRDSDRDACLALFRDWSVQKQAAGLEETGRHMLSDSEAAHREALARHRELGLMGYVVRVDGRIRAYTFGYERSSSAWCVLLEVADRTVHGLAQFIFRECCRKAAERGCEFINTMDDSGLPGLAQSKRAYHPIRLVPSHIVTEL
jgi:uncharacterized protein